MFRKIRKRWTYANVASSIALFAALATGGAYAHGQIYTADIRDDAVTGNKISPKAFLSSDIETLGVGGTRQFEIGSSAIGSTELATISTETKSITVPPIEAGQAGVRGLSVTCPKKGLPISGGVDFGSQADQHQQVIALRRNSSNGWYAKGANYFTEPVTMKVHVYCLARNK